MRVPRGFRDILPTEARELRAIQGQLMATFASYGYVPLDPPMVEFADSTATLDERRMLRFLDRDGRLVALRPDITTSVARLVAQRYATSRDALRLSYFNAVFREEPSMLGSEREYDQAGVELIGVGGLRADAEVIALLADALAACGLRDAEIDVGHVGYLGGYLDGADPSRRAAVAETARRGDFVGAIGSLGLGADQRTALERGLRHRGALSGLEAGAPARSREALAELAALAPLLEAAGVKGVRYDLGFVPAMPYYSGVIFQVTAAGLGFPLAGGGRYDGLLERFGAGRPATGFGIGVPHLHQAMVGAGWVPPTDAALVVLIPSADAVASLRVASALRRAGLAVALGEVAEPAGQRVVRATVKSADRIEYEGRDLALEQFVSAARRTT